MVEHDFVEPLVEPPFEHPVVLRGVVAENLGLEPDRPILLAEVTDAVRGRGAEPATDVFEVWYSRGTRHEPHRGQRRTAQALLFAENLEPGHDRLERAAAFVSQQVDLVDHDQRAVAEEGHAAPVLVLARDAVELFGGGEQYVHVVEFAPRDDIGIARELLAHDADGAERGDPLLLLLLHQCFERGHVDRLELAGFVVESAGRAVDVLHQHLDDSELEEDRLARARRRAYHERARGGEDEVEHLRLDAVEVLEGREDGLEARRKLLDGAHAVTRVLRGGTSRRRRGGRRRGGWRCGRAGTRRAQRWRRAAADEIGVPRSAPHAAGRYGERQLPRGPK